MNVGLVAHNSKKVLLENFCIAYKGILKKHSLFATGMTGKRIETATGLSVSKFLPGVMGGSKQFANEIERNDLDMVIFFHNTNGMEGESESDFEEISRICDLYNIPLASNIATAESLILGLDNGDLEWREM
ncbi:MAG: methylglyoxal synthase [Lachnospiraceae bacterium]